MKIAFTWDYEMFFGHKSGSVKRCMIEPTNRLLEIAKRHESKFTFFVDTGMLVKGRENESFTSDLKWIKEQIKEWDIHGHETGLHIHPHWEDATWNGGWEFDLSRYKLSDFNSKEVSLLFNEYHTVLQSCVKQKIISYRAGGWCVQPFSDIKKSMEHNQLTIESSVFSGGKNTIHPYYYDFTEVPNKDHWRFNDEVCVEDEKGVFLQLPIASQMYNPLFFWRLFILGRLKPSKHKPMGNGFPAKGGGSKKDFLLKKNLLCVSADGYFVTQIEKAIRKAVKRGDKKLVIIGHPKACTGFSLNYLDQLLSRISKKHEIVCLKDL